MARRRLKRNDPIFVLIDNNAYATGIVNAESPGHDPSDGLLDIVVDSDTNPSPLLFEIPEKGRGVENWNGQQWCWSLHQDDIRGRTRMVSTVSFRELKKGEASIYADGPWAPTNDSNRDMG